eukprot:1186182-Ditylum_brightwellii.AAC.1
MYSPSAKTPPPKKKQAPLAKMKCTLPPVAKGKPLPPSVARGKPHKKPGLNKNGGKSPIELLEEEMQITCKMTHDEWKQEVKEGKVQSNCPLSLPFGCMMSNVNTIYK